MNGQCLQVGEFFLDPANRVLKYGDLSISLSPKAFDALVFLAQNAGRLLTRDELIRALWPDSFVEEGNLSVHIFQIRKALGTAADGKAYIQTVPKKGYRFVAEVTVLDNPAESVKAEALRAPGGSGPMSDTGVTGPEKPDSPSGDPTEKDGTAGILSHIRSGTWMLVAAGAVCLVIGLIFAQRLTQTGRQPRTPGAAMRLTSFSPELAVSAAAISPDGNTLAYANPLGVFLEEIATKETRRLQSPASGLRVSNLSWFRDNSALLASGAEPDASAQSVWILHAKGMSDPERVGAFGRGVMSPDASQIALVDVKEGAKQIVLLPAGGGQRRQLATIPEAEDLGSIFWSPDGRRLQFVTVRWNTQLRANQGFIRSVNLATGKTEDVFTAPNLSGEAIALSDERLIYGQLLGANPAGSYGGELRQVYLDSRTGAAVGDSSSLGRWTEQVMGLSSSADGGRLVFRTVLAQHTVYAEDLDAHGESLSRVRRLTFGRGRDDFPRAWTPDSKEIFIDSNRNGKWEIFRQALDQMSDEPYLQSANDEFSPEMSPDGKFLLYLDRPRDWHESEPVRLMRVSTAERFPEVVLHATGYSEWGLRFECARTPHGICVLAQRVGREIVFRRFTPELGVAPEDPAILRIPLDPNLKISWTITPDASQLAWIISDAPDATIHVASLRRASSAESTVLVQQVSHLHALAWSPDGNGWYVTTRLPASWKIIYTNGTDTRILWQGKGGYAPEPWPSPDNRHLAFSQLEQDSNAWMLEKF